MIKRVVDVGASLAGLILFALPMIAIGIAVRLDSPGPAIHWSQRFGAGGGLFAMPKFRTMRIGTPQLPTHLLGNGAANLTRIGGFLRRTSLDELPQLWSVLVGRMSLVGPRPALFNQHDLMALRRQSEVEALRPGITGWAQINGRDDLSLVEKVRLDRAYRDCQSLAFDLHILVLTVLRGNRGIRH